MLCSAYQLGRVGYLEAYKLQADLLNRRVNGAIGDALLLLEHPPTITIGKSGRAENILVSQAELRERDISLFFIDRGGDVTYHGPGQLVGYPIIDLRDRGKDLHQYVHDLEEVIIRALSDFGIAATRDDSHRGVWVGGREMAAIGLRVRKWVTMHGFALNVNTDLEPFSLINPCGFRDREATSMAAVLAQEIEVPAVTEKILARFSEVFSVEMKSGRDNINRAMLVEGRDTVVGNHADETEIAILV